MTIKYLLTYIYIYMYISKCVCVCVYIYIYGTIVFMQFLVSCRGLRKEAYFAIPQYSVIFHPQSSPSIMAIGNFRYLAGKIRWEVPVLPQAVCVFGTLF